jgi:replicative DNA helicase
MRAYGLLQAAEAGLARAAFTAEAVTEATAGLGPALAVVNRDLAPQRADETLLEAVAEYVRTTRAGESQQVVGSWGLQALDERLGSLRAGTMHIVCAFPGHGKSTLGLQAARATSARGFRVLYVTTEMLRAELAMRVLCAENGWSPRSLESAIRGEADDLAGHDVASRIVPEDRQRDVDAIAAQVRGARQGDKPFGVVVLDYLQMLAGPGETEYERLSYIAYRIKQLALDEAVACVVMAQVNRTAASDKMPSMRTLRGSSAIEDAADSVVTMFRTDRGDAGATWYEMCVRIEKARNGQPGDVTTDKERIQLGAGTFRMYEPNRIPDETRERIN